MIRFSAGPEEAGERVDVAVARRSGLPRALVQAALRAGEVTVEGRPARPAQRLRAGDAVSGKVAAPEAGSLRPEDIPIRVLYDDGRVLVVSKPAGLVTHPAPGHPAGTLVNALLGMGGPLAGGEGGRPGIVHRLDKETSGLLLVARDDATLAYLQGALRKRQVRRGYLALVRGRVTSPSGSIDAPVGRHPTRPTRRAVTGAGKPAVTHYRRLAGDERSSLLEIALETGRTHQIRVHLAYLGHPVLGDRAYGGGSEPAATLGLRRPFLHAHRLTWPLPEGGSVTVSDPLPDDLAEALRRAGIALPHDPAPPA